MEFTSSSTDFIIPSEVKICKQVSEALSSDRKPLDLALMVEEFLWLVRYNKNWLLNSMRTWIYYIMNNNKLYKSLHHLIRLSLFTNIKPISIILPDGNN